MTADGRNNTNTKINYSGSSITFASGKCYTLKVISPVPGKGSTERKLYPGDFVFQNETEKRIEIHPGDGMLEENGKYMIIRMLLEWSLLAILKNDRYKMQ